MWVLCAASALDHGAWLLAWRKGPVRCDKGYTVVFLGASVGRRCFQKVGEGGPGVSPGSPFLPTDSLQEWAGRTAPKHSVVPIYQSWADAGSRRSGGQTSGGKRLPLVPAAFANPLRAGPPPLSFHQDNAAFCCPPCLEFSAAVQVFLIPNSAGIKHRPAFLEGPWRGLGLPDLRMERGTGFREQERLWLRQPEARSEG